MIEDNDNYPTWNRVSGDLIVSEQGQEGYSGWVPDFSIHRDGKQWWAKWRTSAGLDGPYSSGAVAMRSIEAAVKK